MRYLTVIILLMLVTSAFGQKKILDIADFDIWNTIENEAINANGDYIMYSLEKGEKDQFLKIKDEDGKPVLEHDRGYARAFSYDGDYAFFTIKAWEDSVSEMKRRKVKSKDMPKDTLGIFSLKSKQLTKIPFVEKYTVPEKWSGYVIYQLTDIPEETVEEDSEEDKKEETSGEEKKTKEKKVGKENGYHLVIRNLETAAQDTFKYVTKYTLAEESPVISFVTTGVDSTFTPGVYVYQPESQKLTNILESEKGKFPQLELSRKGTHLAFVADLDSTKVLIRPNELYRWSNGEQQATMILDASTTTNDLHVSADFDLMFSEDESRLYFGQAPTPVLQDTTLLDDEIVNVEVWTYDEPRLYTVQELQVENDKKKAYLSVYHLGDKKLVQLANEQYPDSRIGDEGNAPFVLLYTQEPHALEGQWRGVANSDYALANVTTGEITEIITDIRSRARLSPEGKYVYGYSSEDSAWFTLNVEQNSLKLITKGKGFWDELNDSPDYPYPYGIAGWTEGDESIIIYDRYDIWRFNPDNGESSRLTAGRTSETVYRYVKLDEEERAIDPKGKWLLSTFSEATKNAGYFEFNSKNSKGKQLVDGPYAFRNIAKAREADKLIFTRESFIEFPDIHLTDMGFKSSMRISNANPQQSEYNWGTSEIVKWVSLDGIELEGMLIKPENFDPNKKYPMIVNFYEKSSDGLHRHRAPSPGRSTINYSFYTSRGYLIFNPDVHYRIGYPGESAYNCVIPGVTSLIEKGFVDKNNIGVQGHSWGGYQIAYLVTKTDMFKAAESGAPVPNMISAYGGIRWWTGLSRQFQYEHTQSRIGGTPWDYPVRYIENSPIFFIDKINTPLLIMHNDADGHVPWYQGIEFFVSLRRLGKPSWFLNYNGEPHWPLKRQNRVDFNIRMAQFFDHYLKGAPRPVWMERGVPAIEKGINQGYELIEK